MQANSDSALFYTVSNGRPDTAMVSWSATYGETDRWHLVNYIYSLGESDDPNYDTLLVAQCLDEDLDISDPETLFAGASKARFPLLGQIVEGLQQIGEQVRELELHAAIDVARQALSHALLFLASLLVGLDVLLQLLFGVLGTGAKLVDDRRLPRLLSLGGGLLERLVLGGPVTPVLHLVLGLVVPGTLGVGAELCGHRFGPSLATLAKSIAVLQIPAKTPGPTGPS